MLPSYQEAITGPDIPSLIAPFLDLKGLQAANRVNKTWCKAMSRYLWADPIRSFAASARPFYQTARFKLNSGHNPKYRKELRDLVTTIDYGPLLARIHAPALRRDFNEHEMEISFNWIFQHAGLFKNLRFIILDGLTRAGDDEEVEHSEQGTRILLLSARHIPFSRLENVLTKTLFMDLIFLDLSYTCRPEDLNIQSRLDNLRILKLRGLRLTKIPRFVLVLGKQLWSLDLRDNLLDGIDIVHVLRTCFQENYPNLVRDQHPHDDIHHLYDDPPVYHRIDEGHNPTTDFAQLRPDSASSFIKYVTDNGNLYSRNGVLSFEDPVYVRTGLTHLYISGNRLKSSTIKLVLESQNRLQVLDVGSVRLDSAQIQYKAIYGIDRGVERISPIFGSRLEKLRIHHSAVTRIPTILQFFTATGFDPECLQQAESMHNPEWSRLSPLAHHRLRSLTLTDIPTKSYGPMIEQLTGLLTELADQEEKLAAARAAMPNNRRAPQVLGGLRTLRLEFLPEAPAPETSSVSGDRDADGFLSKSLGDFSFFGGSGGAEWVEKKRSGPTREKANGKGKGKEKEEGPRDVVEELKKFRRTQKPAGWGGVLELVWPQGH
ncbi:uncharacterized protein PAC_15875 [Phialocephala subalpina]|uniref:Uncharacterized protein n=1 Tax=Phialocephala subalpina TaxID=576137 RepID=A0A1L7XLP7_9HELO|nr:uncharacterized protein PAC_15875 [Phialocephala subalpina]